MKLRKLFYPLVGLALTLGFLTLYYGAFRHFHYPSAPGGDLYNHFLYTQELQQHGVGSFFSGYPKLFHAVVLLGMTVTGKPAATVMLYLLPLVLVAMGWAAAFVAFELGGWPAALLTLFLVLFVSAQPSQTLYDGGFPSVISAHIWLPLLVGSLGRGMRTKRIGWFAAAFGFFLLMLATHAFTLLYPVLIVLSLGLFYWRRAWPYLLGGLGLAALLLATPAGVPVRNILSTVVSLGGGFPWIHVVGSLQDPNAIWPLAIYPNAISYLTVWFGILGCVLLAYAVWQRTGRSGTAYLVLVWCAVLFVGSRIEALGFPVRLARDLGGPLAIAAAFAIIELLKMDKGRLWWGGLVIGLAAWLGFPHLADKLDRLRHYEPTMQFSAADQLALKQIGSAQAISLDMTIPYTFSQNVFPWFVILVPPDKYHGTVHFNETGEFWTQKSEYALYEVRPSHNGDTYAPYLEALGMREYARYSDPLKTVVLYRRQP